ncbi:phage tail protein [Candidatus Hamiltonella defensa]|uniref:Phage tail protein n=1 Tax=Candidatus Williamhamiltonella defendens TaxID=138072 RepID=A0AAC9VN43_9ENTR|nr:phage tail protein [Candidatus Hamiltonella defensa]ASV34144.1 phage tail protein [Candidatus Hamiltonella defensa]AWK17103.1 phage tail protein [Candidatus Hamiltonella defensa]MBK4361666.1 phage tail protein [Candidatus Hamiltonella defensa]
MTDLTELSQWEDGIYQIETRDPVLGGPEGIANRQAQQLGNRTTFLKEGQDRLNTEFYHHREEEDPHPVYALKKSPDFTGEPKAPTPEFKNSSRQLATTEFVTRAVNALTDGAPEALDTLKELAKALGEERDFSTQILQQLSQKLSKNDHGADIPDKAQFIKNLGLSETVDCAKNALDKRHGGEVQGQIQVNDTLRVSKNGKTATYQEDGNIDGECWGGLLNQWITTKITEAVQSRAPWEEVNRTFVRDIRLSSVQLMSVQTYDRQLSAGAVVTGFKTNGLWEMKSYAYYRFIQKNINGQWITVGQG